MTVMIVKRLKLKRPYQFGLRNIEHPTLNAEHRRAVGSSLRLERIGAQRLHNNAYLP
jgi:hypothetical protein